MTIQETTAALRQNAKDIDACKNPVRLVRLHDRRWDLEARYAMLLRQAGLEDAR